MIVLKFQMTNTCDNISINLLFSLSANESGFYLNLSAWCYYRTFATGAACQQRTLTPPDTWSCPALELACILTLRPISPELVLFPDFWVSNIPRFLCFAPLHWSKKMYSMIINWNWLGSEKSRKHQFDGTFQKSPAVILIMIYRTVICCLKTDQVVYVMRSPYFKILACWCTKRLLLR